MATIVHLTTIHSRTDTRIFLKEARTLASNLLDKVFLIVADGKGSVDAQQGGVSIHDLGNLGVGRLGRMLRGPLRAFFTIIKIKPAIVHFHDPELIPLAILLRLIGYKVIYDVHEDVPRQILSKHYLPWILRKPIASVISVVELSGARAFDAIAPATPKIAERFPVDKTVTVQNFPLAAELISADSILYLERPKSFVYVGKITSIRGVIKIIRAFAYLQDIPDAKLELGGVFRPSSLENEVRKLPEWNSVNFHGQVSRAEVAKIMGAARAGLVLFYPVPNHIDAQPNKMFEYMSAGLPVIASDFPLWRCIIGDSQCGLLVDPLNHGAIAEAMRWILDHPAEAEAMGWRGRQAVERTYNWNAEAVKLLSLYKKLQKT